ncbi:MAG: Fic family protein [Lautropia sp.]
MSDWDADGPRLAENLQRAQRLAVDHALARRPIRLTDIKAWHRIAMEGLRIDDAKRLGIDPRAMVGEFRGPPRLPDIEVRIGSHPGVPATEVDAACRKFIATLRALTRALDRRFPADSPDDLDVDGLRAVAEAAAWAHAEWVRIHPFVNGNGRTARLLGNVILVRFGLPPVFRLRPRPEGSYPVAASQAMTNGHRALADYVVAQLLQYR